MQPNFTKEFESIPSLEEEQPSYNNIKVLTANDKKKLEEAKKKLQDFSIEIGELKYKQLR